MTKTPTTSLTKTIWGDDDKWKRVQFGWQIGATLDINKFNVGIGYGIDFNEIADDARFGIFSARLGYNF